MTRARSIRFHLSSVFIFFFLLIIFLGLLSIARLRDFNHVSASIADLWLPTTRVLGDLNNYTSDFRAAEGNMLLAPSANESEIEHEMVNLDQVDLAGANGLRDDPPRPGRARLLRPIPHAVERLSQGRQPDAGAGPDGPQVGGGRPLRDDVASWPITLPAMPLAS